MITWDENKRLANLDKHGLDFADLDEAFFFYSLVIDAKQGRYKALGMLEDGTIAVIFATMGTEAIRVISMRPASKKERQFYDKHS
mgnify:CR=1 FL=1